MIVVETNTVQKSASSNKVRFVGKDKPIAERLDRTHFGFDQDYYERMPLLVNALQEVSYVNPSGESISRSKKRYFNRQRSKPSTTTADNRFMSIRRTSPRPFIFEYRSPYPMPFSKMQDTPRNWVEHYRNAQRMKNLHDVVKYLEKSLNAKFSEVLLPTRAQIAISGIIVPPTESSTRDSYLPIDDYEARESQNYNVKSNHNSDPLYTYRPESPGDINLLVDGYRFAPSAFTFQNKQKHNGNLNMFRTVSDRKRLQHCKGVDCSSPYLTKTEDSSQEEIIPPFVRNSEPKVMDIKLNVFSSQKPSPDNTLSRSNINKIYITTPRPLFQFRRKSTVPYRRSTSAYTYTRPNIFVEKRKNITITTSKTGENRTITLRRLVPLSVFTANEKTHKNSVQPDKKENVHSEETTPRNTAQDFTRNDYTTEYPILNYLHVEDFHVGSSGVIPIESRTITPIYPLSMPIMPFTERNMESMSTNPPEIIKFNPEDARIPVQYINTRKSDVEKVTEREKNEWDYSETTENYKDNVETETLIIKLKNVAETTTNENISEETVENEEAENEDSETTTSATYVPQINGHHRHVNYKSLTTLLRENSERYRKKKLENLITTRTIKNNTYVPMYVEIKRNRSTFVDYSENNEFV